MDQPENRLVNYGRPLPPAATRWKEGQSGNPKGRPKKDESILDLLKEFMQTLCPTDPEQRTYAELLVRALVHQGMKGNMRAVREILNRLVGKVPLPIERIGSANPSNQKSSQEENSLPAGKRVRLSLEKKNEILAICGLEPIAEEAENKADTPTGQRRGHGGSETNEWAAR